MTPFHLVQMSPWPLFSGLVSLLLTMQMVNYMWMGVNIWILLFMMLLVILICYQWWRDVSREGSWSGDHTFEVQNGLKIGMLLFILSEVMFFLSFFWAFFYSSVAPTVELGSIWPPLAVDVFDYLGVPLLNTVILVSSGVTLTWCHSSLVNGSRYWCVFSLFLTILLAFIFSGFQVFEYLNSNFTISDCVYGSVFFLATGFHGTHVMIGGIFLSVLLLRLMNGQLGCSHHVGFEVGSWYWHFVDVVWLFLYVCIYWWGS